MKNYLFILLLCLALPGCAQEYSTIKGFVKGAGLKEVTLYKTVDGSPQVYATSRVGADGSYGFLLNPEPGFYSIGEERLNFPVYLKGGEEVNRIISPLDTGIGFESSKRSTVHMKITDENYLDEPWPSVRTVMYKSTSTQPFTIEVSEF